MKERSGQGEADEASAAGGDRVSVVITAYNYERYVAETIDSVLAQTRPFYELLVVDDGSKDGTKGVVAGYGDRVRYVYQENAGPSAARNTGIDEARGEVILFVDGDDLLEPDALERMCGRLESLSDDYVLIASGFGKLIDSGGAVTAELDWMKKANREITCRDLLLKNRFSSNVLVRKSIFEKSGTFDPTMRHSEDRDLWIRIANQGRIFQLGESVIRRRHHGENISFNITRHIAGMKKTIRKGKALGAVSPWNFLFWLRVKSIFHYQISRMYRANGRLWRARFELATSFLCWPFFLSPAKLAVEPLFRLRLARGLLLNTGGMGDE